MPIDKQKLGKLWKIRLDTIIYTLGVIAGLYLTATAIDLWIWVWGVLMLINFFGLMCTVVKYIDHKFGD